MAAKVVRVAAMVLAALVLVLAVTGLWLTFEYRPGPPRGVRRTHQLASTLAVWTALVWFFAGACRRRLRPLLVGFACLVAMVAASFTGFLLPWDQLALRAVTVGSSLSGVFVGAFDDQVRFVLLGGTEISVPTYRRWVLVHTVGIPVAALIAVAVWQGRKFLLRR